MIDTVRASTYLDPRVLADLRALSGPDEDVLADLRDTFLVHAREQLMSLLAALDARDSQAVWQAAHRLKGSAFGIGAWRFAKLVGTVEFAASNGALDRAVVHAKALADEFESTCIALERAVGA